MPTPDTLHRLDEIVTIAGKQVYVRDHYDEAIKIALRNGSYESGERNVIPHVLEPGDRVLEVGSAIGVLCMTSSGLVGGINVVGYDANPAIVADARENFNLNGETCTVHCAVLQNRILWNGPGSQASFYVNKAFWASSMQYRPSDSEKIDVPTLCFESTIAHHGANVLICDIEGGEIELLEHADLSGINKIIMEIHYWAGRESVNRMMRKLFLSGFMINVDLSGRSIVTLHRGLSWPIGAR